MHWEGWLTLAAAVGLLVGLARRIAPPDMLALACLGVLVIVGEISGSSRLPGPGEAVAGFGNPGLITIALLFAVVAGLEATGGTQLAVGRLLKRPRSVLDAQVRLVGPVAAMSAFLNNTPVVAALLPVVTDLAKRMQISPSRLLLPLSYAAILGGTCTLIGTSTNLIVHGLLQGRGHPGIGFFELAWVGVPIAAIGLTFVVFAGRRLLRDRRPAVSLHDDPRQYTVEMTVTPGGPLVGRSIEDAGLRHLPGLYLAEIGRNGHVMPAVSPAERLQPRDVLVFVGVLESVVDLRKIRGLMPATDQTHKIGTPEWHRTLVEAVVSPRCPIVGKTIREGRFRTRYGAAVIAVARGGSRVPGKLGDVRLQPGDVLLLEAPSAFVQTRRDSRDFFLVSAVENSTPQRHDRAWIALGVLVVMVLVAALQWVDLLAAALVAAVAMVALRCCSTSEARRSIDWSVLVVIGATLGIGQAIETSGAASAIAGSLLDVAGGNPRMVLAAVYLATMLCTELITNNAAAALMFPLAWKAAGEVGADPVPFAICVMIAASAGFATPFGYQTNLMVYGPGGYRPEDYLRLGGPLDAIAFAISMLVIPWVWPL